MNNRKNNGFVRNPFLYLLIIVAAVTGFQYFFAGNGVGQSQQINYTELVKEIKNDNVKTISYQPNGSVIEIAGTYNKAKESKEDTGIQFFTPSVQKVSRFTSVILPSDITVNELQKLAADHKAEITIKRESSSGMWITILTSIVPFVIVMFFFFSMMNQGGGGGARGAMNFGRNKARAANKEDIKVRFSDVAGAEEEKQELVEVVEFLKDPKRFTKLGARIPAGVLLEGPPGTGKTLLARAVAGEAKVPFYYISGSDFVELFVGVGASRVRDMFKQAKQNAPCLIFIDEIDAVGRQRGTGLGGGHDEREQTLNQLLTEMDGFGANEGIIIIAATNRPDVLDPALLRPGRFDRQVTVNLPDVREREAILNVHAKGKIFDKAVNLKRIAERTPGYSGADLENLLNEAALLAVRRNKDDIGMDEIDEASDRVLMGPAKVSRKVTDYEKNIVAYHESGHAVLGIELPNGEEVHKITIIPRGMAGGYTQMLPKEERTLVATKDELLQRITSYLGGRVSEELFCGEISTGASDDFKRATQIARSMVTEYGMSDLGPVQFEHKSGEVFLGRDYTNSSKNYSDAVALEIDKEIRKIINECYKNAKDILSKNKGLVEALAKTLYEKETITKEEIEEVVREYNEGKKTKKKDKVEE